MFPSPSLLSRKANPFIQSPDEIKVMMVDLLLSNLSGSLRPMHFRSFPQVQWQSSNQLAAIQPDTLQFRSYRCVLCLWSSRRKTPVCRWHNKERTRADGCLDHLGQGIKAFADEKVGVGVWCGCPQQARGAPEGRSRPQGKPWH